MPSPFPGMDPYIESCGLWPDFHASLIVTMRAALNARLPERYTAGVELHVWIHEPDAAPRTQLRAPDVHVAYQGGPKGRVAVAPATVVLPLTESETQRFIQIVDQENQRVVTAFELLSPSNKAAGPDREAYLNKRNEFLNAGVSLVEIDLLRGGPRLPLGDSPPEVAAYYVLVCRAWERPRAGFWNVGLRDPLPDIPVPLDPDVAEVLFPLRPCIDRVYEEARYASRLRYDESVKPRLRKPDAAWVRQILAARQGQPPSPPTTSPA
jgi:uncharacterized protein DUF4058